MCSKDHKVGKGGRDTPQNYPKGCPDFNMSLKGRTDRLWPAEINMHDLQKLDGFHLISIDFVLQELIY